MPADNQRQEHLLRRRVLAMTGAAGAAALAGCSSDDDAADEFYEDLDEVEVDHNENYEDEFDQVVPSGPVNPYNAEFIFNPYHTQWNAGDAQEFGCEYLAVYNTEDGEFIPRVADDWEIDDETLETRVELSDEYGWSDGSPITAADFVTALKLQGYMEMGLQDFIDPETGIYTDGEYTLVIEPREGYEDLEEELWMNQWAEAMLDVSEEQYGEFIEEFEDAETDDEIEGVQEDVISLESEWNQSLFSGPFVFVEANEEFADQIPNPEHPIAQDWEFYLRHGVYADEEGLQAEEVDWEHNDPSLENLPSIYDEPPASFSGQTFALIFGVQDEYVRDYPEVRRALAHVVDAENITETSRSETPVDTYSAGIDTGYIDHFVHDEVLDGMTNYAPVDTDRATELLEEVGFSQDDGDWYTPDGDEWTLDFPAGDWFPTASEMVYNNLAEFGIDLDWYIEEMPTYQSQVEPDLEYDITVHLNYGMARQYHAYADLDEEFNNPDRGILTERTLFDEEVEVPEVGNPDGDTVSFNVSDELEGLATADDEEAMMDHATNLAWIHNQLMPAMMIHPWSEHYWVNAGEWDFDLETDDWLTSNRIAHYLLQNGLSPE